MRVGALVALGLLAGCEDEPAPVATPPPVERMAEERALGEYEGTATYWPGYQPSLGAERETPTGPGVTVDAIAYVQDMRPGSGAQLATFALRVGDDRITTEVIMLPRADQVLLRATRPVTCESIVTGGGTDAHVDGDELVLQQLRLEQPCQVGSAESQLWRFRGRRTRTLAP